MTNEIIKDKDADGFWMVWREGGQRPRFKHYTRDEAKVEAQRVAEKHPNCNVYILQTCDVVAAKAPEQPELHVSWRNFNND